MATVTITVELFDPGFESVVVDDVLAVFEILVPEAIAAPTFTVKVNVVVAPDANDVSVQLTVVTGAPHVKAVPVCVRLT